MQQIQDSEESEDEIIEESEEDFEAENTVSTPEESEVSFEAIRNGLLAQLGLLANVNSEWRKAAEVMESALRKNAPEELTGKKLKNSQATDRSSGPDDPESKNSQAPDRSETAGTSEKTDQNGKEVSGMAPNSAIHSTPQKSGSQKHKRTAKEMREERTGERKSVNTS